MATTTTKSLAQSSVRIALVALCLALGMVLPRIALAATPTFDSAEAAYKAVIAEWQDRVDGLETPRSGTWSFTTHPYVMIDSSKDIKNFKYAYVADNDFGPNTLVVGDTTDNNKLYGIYQYLPDQKVVAYNLASWTRANRTYYYACEDGYYRDHYLDDTQSFNRDMARRPKGYTSDDTGYYLSFVNFDYIEYDSDSPNAIYYDVKGSQKVMNVADAQKQLEDKYPSNTKLTWYAIKGDFHGPDVAYPIAMLRVYNKWTGEHLYTQDPAERDQLVALGWTSEGVAWNSPSTSNTPVYRLYNSYSGDHHYTTSKAEYDQLGALGWTKEGIGFYSDDAKGVATYRLYNQYVQIGTHHYTTDKTEYDQLGKVGWTQESIAWYGLK